MRRISHLLTVVLCLAVGAAWARSWSVADDVAWRRRRAASYFTASVSAQCGAVRLATHWVAARPPNTALETCGTGPPGGGHWSTSRPDDRWWRRAGFRFDYEWSDASHRRQSLDIDFPYWSLLLACVAAPYAARAAFSGAAGGVYRSLLRRRRQGFPVGPTHPSGIHETA